MAGGDVLGLGYAGYAVFDGIPLLMVSASPSEQENLIKSQGSIATQIKFAVGEIPVRDRRALNISLNCILNNRAIPLIGASSFDWWAANKNGKSHKVEIYPANEDGYKSDEVYVQSLSINAQENSLVTIAFNIVAYRWELKSGHLPVRSQKRMETFFGDDNWPVPSWMTSVENSAMPGITSSWQLVFGNNYQFQQLLEITARPPTPRLVFPGPPSIDLTLTNIAEPGSHPKEAGSVVVKIGGGSSPAVIPQTKITIPFMYRDPQQAPEGTGDQNALIRWQAGYKAMGAVPTKG